jgi:hypothetical protein
MQKMEREKGEKRWYQAEKRLEEGRKKQAEKSGERYVKVISVRE